MRGSLNGKTHSKRLLGIIPAYAGLTTSATSASAASWDHPRVCGAHIQVKFRFVVQLGSSPRMRGSLVG